MARERALCEVLSPLVAVIASSGSAQMKHEHELSGRLRSAAVPWVRPEVEETFLQWVGDARFVLIGEATHGTHEFYSERAWLTRLLIERRGFVGVAIEGDWPHANQVHRHIQNPVSRLNSEQALRGFKRFPQWMWRNTVLTEWLSWLHAWNSGRQNDADKVGFYGLDLYSLHGSIEAVVEYLEKADPGSAKAARRSYSCFEDFGHDPESYAWAAGRLGEGSCEDAVVEQLLKLRQREQSLVRDAGSADAEEFFSAEQNARLARNAEKYYRTMVRGHVESWNLRDRHMAETLGEIEEHLRKRGPKPKLVVWAHNSHLGDARATEMGRSGELNLGQLVREQYGDDVRLLGLTTYTGSVTAASDWGDPPALKRVRAGLDGSYESLFHQLGMPNFFLPIRGNERVREILSEERLERAIGVVYRPETERYSHYIQANLADQFDGVLHLDFSRALTPLERSPAWEPSEMPETYPTGV